MLFAWDRRLGGGLDEIMEDREGKRHFIGGKG